MKHSLADPVAMWHVRSEIAPAILLVVDFGGWYKLDSKSSNGSSPERIGHTQVSLIKDVIVPYTHLLPRLSLLENKERSTLLYFKGAKHRHRVSIQFTFFSSFLVLKNYCSLLSPELIVSSFVLLTNCREAWFEKSCGTYSSMKKESSWKKAFRMLLAGSSLYEE